MSTLRVDTITDEVGTGPVSFPNGATGVDPLKYNAVSGATQALDVGTYNFFDAGTLTADTTVSFSSVPTEARWTYTATADVVSTPWDITDLSYVRNFSVAVESLNPQSVFFKPDGTAMYVVNSTNVDEYSLSTAWDISTVSYTRTFDVSTQEGNPTGLFFKPDGTAMYIIGVSGDDVNEYSLSTAWDVSTASYVRVYSVSTQQTAPRGIFFKPDGTAMYVVGTSSVHVSEYSLSTAWNVSTASHVRNFVVSGEDTLPSDIFFKPDGTVMYILGDIGNDVNEYSLSTAWNISTASFVRNTSVSFQEASPTGLFFKPDGTAMYVTGSTGDDVNQYSLGPLAVITLPSSVQNPPSEALVAEAQVSYTFFTADGGTTVKLTNEEVL